MKEENKNKRKRMWNAYKKGKKNKLKVDTFYKESMYIYGSVNFILYTRIYPKY